VVEWELQWGEDLPLLDRRRQRGLPSALDHRPEPYEDVADALVAFRQLSRARTAGFAPNPISIAEIEAWLRLNDVTATEDRREFVVLIQAMDQVWLKRMMENYGRPDKKPDAGS